MRNRISLIAGLTALFVLGSAGATGTSTSPDCGILKASDVNPDTGHYFEIYAAPRISWTDAKVCANKPNATYPGINGHLATITSSRENVWIVELLRRPVLVQFEGGRTQVWVADPGMRAGGVGKTAKDRLQRFRLHGGTEYSNWPPDEPNNLGGTENHLTLGRFSTDLSGWNDEGNLSNITGSSSSTTSRARPSARSASTARPLKAKR